MTDWTGAISGSQTAIDGDRITGNITIGAGATFTITAGATITFQGAYNITITSTGAFVCAGTVNSRITLKSGVTNPEYNDWAYIYWSGPTSTTSKLEYTTVKNASQPNFILPNFGSGGSMGNIKYCIFEDSSGGAIGIGGSANAFGHTISNCEFRGLQGQKAIYVEGSDANNHTIQDCYFYSNPVLSPNGAIYLNTTGTGTITIQRNLFVGVKPLDAPGGATLTISKNIFFNLLPGTVALDLTRTGTTTPVITVSNNIIGCDRWGSAYG